MKLWSCHFFAFVVSQRYVLFSFFFSFASFCCRFCCQAVHYLNEEWVTCKMMSCCFVVVAVIVICCCTFRFVLLFLFSLVVCLMLLTVWHCCCSDKWIAVVVVSAIVCEIFEIWRRRQNRTERHDIHSESPCHRVRFIVLCLFQPTWSSSSSSPFILFISFIFRWYDKDSGMCSFFRFFSSLY